jgi:hypothetical protein
MQQKAYSLIASLLIVLTSFSAVAKELQPVDFFRKALNESGYKDHQVKIVTTFDPFKYASRVLYYGTRAGQKIGSRETAWKFYRIKFQGSQNKEMDCVGGLGFQEGYSNATRLVDIEQCNQGFFDSSVLIESPVTLD